MASDDTVLLFDLGGVLVEATGRSALKALLPYASDESEILERWHRSPAVNLFERGRVAPGDFARMFVNEWGIELGELAFMENFATWVTGFFEGAIPLIQALRRRHRVGCLSNTNAIHWARLPGIADIFDFCFPSHATGCMKPDREAYMNVLRELRVSAERIWFFDDLLPNVAAARESGMRAFHVDGFPELRQLLQAEGLAVCLNDQP
jgi:putative hydrolase of the HAD superfamily